MKNKILITGATGLVGKALTRHFLNAGFSVNYLSTRPIPEQEQSGLRGYSWNPASGTIDLDCFEGVTSIINLAGSTINSPWTTKGKASILESRIDSLSCLRLGLTACSSHCVSYLVSASAIGIYPSSEGAWYTEENEVESEGFLASVVRNWEAEVHPFERLSIKTGILRIGLVLSNQGGVLPVLLQPTRLGLGAPFGTGKQWQSWIHIDDLTAMFHFVIKEQVEGVFNAVSPNPVTQSKLIQTLGNALNRPVWLPAIPAWVLKIGLGARSRLVLDSQRVSPAKIQELGFTFAYPNLDPALENLLQGKKG